MPTNVEEFLTKEERNERWMELRLKENPPRGLVRFSESVDAENCVGPYPKKMWLPSIYKTATKTLRRKPRHFPLTRKLQFRKRAPGHCVWYVAWSV